jgi:YidC/Oxa1 family membrane protein insertase
MERRVFLAILLSFVVLYGYQAFFAPPPPAEQKAASTTQASASSSTPAPASTPSTAAVTPAPTGPEPAAVTTEAAEREIVVETATVEAVLSNRGGRVLHWRLKEYRDDAGKPVDLVPSSIPADQPTPFSLRVDDAQVTQRLNQALYRATGDTAGRVDATANAATLVFEYQDAAGVHARKEFRFEPRNYVVDFSATVMNGNQALNPTILWGPGLGDAGAAAAGGSFFTGNVVQPPQAIYHRDGKVERIAATALAEQGAHEGQFRFAGVDDHYFIATAVNAGQARVDYKALSLPGAGETKREMISQSIRFQQPPQSVKFFVGPKQFDLLRSVDAELVRTINFGMFAFLVVPLLSALKWIHGFLGNYGASIIALTILINLVMFPLRHKSVVSMRKMQAIQPQIKSIQDRYADLKMTDPAKQKMNTEIMNLYREKGVNPASGCVPMLLTFPVLFAFYSLLQQSIELRGAPFGLWIHDLSQHDPYYVTPILMAATMWWQQKLTPTTADPAQQKIMMMMPLVFGFMFLQFPSGLAIYYLVSNIFQIGQQYFTTWLIGPPAVQAPRPPAERRLKPAGAGRTAAADRKN